MSAPDDPMNRNSRGKRPGFYDHPALDQMMSMLMVLTGEISVLADQIDLMKRAAASLGVDLGGAMESLELDQPALEAREARRQALLDRVFYLMRKEAAEAGAVETSEGYHQLLAEIAQA